MSSVPDPLVGDRSTHGTGDVSPEQLPDTPTPGQGVSPDQLAEFNGDPGGEPIDYFAALPEDGTLLDEVRTWLGRYVVTLHDSDLDLLTLWAAHTHVAAECYTSPRLILDSPVPGSGKTTTLEHLERLTHHAVQMAAVSSSALLVRMLDKGPRTLLIDEVDRSLDPKRETTTELLAILNSGYKRGATRPVLVPNKENGWVSKEMTTFAPVAMAGNSPNLPEDTRSRCVRVLLMPDLDGEAEDSDWEVNDEPARELGKRLAAFGDQQRHLIRETRPDMPEGIRGRNAEKWRPLKRVAVAAGGRWPEVVDALAVHDKEQQEMDREDGLITTRPHVALLTHLHAVWPEGETFVPTADLIDALVLEHPSMWGDSSTYGKRLTPQRFGRMLASAYGVNSSQEPDGRRRRGYRLADLQSAFTRMRVAPEQTETPPPGTVQTARTIQTVPNHPPSEPVYPVEPAEPVRGTPPSNRSNRSNHSNRSAPGVPCKACGQPMSYTEPGQETHPACQAPALLSLDDARNARAETS